MDLAKMKAIIEGLYIAKVHEAFGQEGTSHLRDIMDCLTRIYRRVDPGTRKRQLIVFCRLPSKWNYLIENHSNKKVDNIAHLSNELDNEEYVESINLNKLIIHEKIDDLDS